MLCNSIELKVSFEEKDMRLKSVAHVGPEGSEPFYKIIEEIVKKNERQVIFMFRELDEIVMKV